MTFSIIGTGNIAWFLAKRLTTAGHQCVGIYGRNKEAATELAEWIQAKPYTSIAAIQDGSVDLCFLAVSDHAIESIVANIYFEKTVLVHTAGSVDLGVLSAYATDHAVLWPVYSILKNNLPNHRNIPCALQASTPKAQRYISSIAHGITDVIFESTDEQRKWLHLSAVISNNFVNHLMTIAEQACTTKDINFNLLHPILAQTFDRVQRSSPHLSQTGPASRGDQATISAHLSMLEGHNSWHQVYTAISTSIENMYNVGNTKNEVKH